MTRCANADGVSLDFYVTPTPETEGQAPSICRVNVFTKGSKNYLFLPGCWDSQQVFVHLKGRVPQSLTVMPPEVEAQPLVNHAATNGFVPGSTSTIRLVNERSLMKVDVLQGGKIPCLFIQTENGTLKNIHSSRETRETGQMVMLSAEGSVLYNGGLKEIKARGNTTFGYLKKPYQIKLENKEALLGTGKAKTWILLADYMDISLLRNRITLDMARYVGMRYAVAAQSVDLFIDGQYLGVYLLTEKVQVDPSRVAIHDVEAEMEFLNPKPLTEYATFEETFADGSRVGGYLLDQAPSDITGGYLLEIDKAYRIRKFNKSFVFTAYGMGILVDTPAVVDKSQILYLSELINAFDRAIRQSDGIDPVTQWHYADIFDEDSLALKFLLEEVSQNYDAKAGSQYFYKDRSAVDPKIYAGPGWDYDLAYGNILKAGPLKGYLTEPNAQYVWYTAVYRGQPAFRQKVLQLYLERFRPALEILCGEREAPATGVLRSLKSYKEEIGPSAQMNFARWNAFSIKGYNKRMGRTFDRATNSLEKFLEGRIKGLDEVFGIE